MGEFRVYLDLLTYLKPMPCLQKDVCLLLVAILWLAWVRKAFFLPL